MERLDRNGLQIAYSVAGEGETVLLTHSFGDTGRMWGPQIAALSSGYRVVAWDMRGHGESDSPADADEYSEAATVADMAAILDTVGAEQAVLGGLSLGGYMSLAFYRQHPERVRALVLSSTGPGFRNPASRQQHNDNAERQATALEEQGLAPLGRSDEVTRVRGGHRSAQGLAHAARGMLKQFDSRIIDSLEAIDVPALVLVGEKDRAYLAGSDYMAGRIPNARKQIIPNAGHTSNLHQPEIFNRAVLEFLAAIGILPAVAG